ncbi:MAG: hypothetical protein A3G33_03370 [Omnitrophica bacterium RIFCSPLOWO2_12_FULL_44_17]|uniref:diguanylate cyclase n=1 Tax=Candidatus Danuiimicrobium aquiferis TaxID=1801832 RepID=A0A1G1KTX5_9BACT|nr:MAG: hypothetical protein A3B72_06915 [Omnitrophica bacterium RIFCSPHIGHO2_02_FULL_45_28]OGW90185.1 MAG: hypothetical protein A3E74_06405 [Omnitrophica bacterium RIFCSPHIGHO2_12_FULL_44_12]OGW96357.1 MAG: hypothetical protein A3G33_03370 [Omnitrophica bacterium RIFCSPLOWO2_12_FULL_44_17]OGX04834.1 MAG: hypothetical protein A3J12_07760 [Omnitrophica bacterium RIFCSPLOWO2_02_FULL_44_11]
MLKRICLLTSLIAFLMWAQIAAFKDPSKLFFFLPPFFLIMLVLWMRKQMALLIFVANLLLLAMAISLIKTMNLFYLVIPVAISGLLCTYYLHQKIWEKTILRSGEKKQNTINEMQAIKDRYDARIESLNYLERQVSGLIKVFEMARDFNDCLSFSELLQAIDRKMTPEVAFSAGTIILSENTEGVSEQVRHVFSFGNHKRLNDEENLEFAKLCLEVLTGSSQVIKFEKKSDHGTLDKSSLEIEMPLWIFPLLVKQKPIALVVIEGGNMSDFPKFEIMASQLALQIQKIQLYETVKEISILDGLTKIFVRRHFMERFEEELGRALRYKFPLSVLMVDVDHFKSYNDKFGHLVGDKALRQVAQVIRENIRRVDVLGRFGGEEFIIVAPEIDKSKSMELAERIRSSVARKHLRIYDEEIKMTVSIGTSAFPDDLEKSGDENNQQAIMDELIQKADQALYRAKEEGRNRVVAYA